jgi:hypothetical protein
VLGTASNEASLVSRLGEIPSQVEKVMADKAYFGVLTMLSVVTSHYDGIDL